MSSKQYSNVRGYSATEILNRVAKFSDGFTHFPDDYWLIGVRSNEDEFNVADDKFYLFKGEKFVKIMYGSTNAGERGLKKFDEYNSEGVAHLKANTIVYDYAKRGKHKGKVWAYRQSKPFPYFRDNNKDTKVDEMGEIHTDIIYANIHPMDYIDWHDFTKKWIGGWSLACQIVNNRKEYDEFMTLTEGQEYLTYCLLQEWDD